MWYASATNCSVVPLAYSTQEFVLLARISYTDQEANVVTQLVSVDTGNRNAINYIGNAVIGVSSLEAAFVKETGVLVVAYSAFTKSANVQSTQGTSIVYANLHYRLLTA